MRPCRSVLGSDLPGQVVYPDPAVSLCRLIVIPPKGNFARFGGHADPGIPSVSALGVFDSEL